MKKDKWFVGKDIQKHLKGGKSYRWIAKELNCSKSTVNYHAQKLGLATKLPRKKFDWKEIQKFYDSGNNYTTCKEKFGFQALTWQRAIESGKIVTRDRTSILKEWLKGNNNGCDKSGKLIKDIKKYLKDKSNNKCSLCSWDVINPVTGWSPLEIDHIDGNWANNNPTNLRVLCPNCHALQSTHKGLNRGKGRPYTIRYT
jgi:hypothetical protein